VSDLRWLMVRCVACRRLYRCTPSSDYFHPRGTPESERTATSGRCWDCHLALVAPDLKGQPEPRLGDRLYR
jgi:hypothetical protein